MRKAAVILLLLALAFTGTGYYFLYAFSRHEAKKEMKAWLKSGAGEGSITALRLSAKEAGTLQWEDDHEFMRNGAMYDVVSIEHKDNGVLIRCVEDSRENRLISWFMKRSGRRRSDQQSSLLKLLSSPYTPSYFFLEPIHPKEWRKEYISFRSPLLQRPGTITGPPPKMGC